MSPGDGRAVAACALANERDEPRARERDGEAHGALTPKHGQRPAESPAQTADGLLYCVCVSVCVGIGIVGLCRDFLQEELRCSSFFIEF